METAQLQEMGLCNMMTTQWMGQKLSRTCGLDVNQQNNGDIIN